MKRCSTCNRTYTDPNLSFCIDDGTPLTVVDSQDESTVVSPRDGDAPYRPPAAYVPPQTRRKRVWPWVVGIGGAFILGIIAITIAAVVLAPRIRSRQGEPRVVVNEPSNANQPQNSNSVAPANSNSNSNVNNDVPPPEDEDTVKAQLEALENEWTVANINADKQALDRILADDFVGMTAQGETYGKADYIRTITRESGIEKWDFDDLKLNLVGDRASLSGKITYERNDRDDEKLEFLDKFVWRDGRWQATASAVKPRD